MAADGHVVARVKEGISLPLQPGGGWLPDGSRMTWLNAPSGKTHDRLPVRAAEHNAVLPRGDGEEVSETCTLITTLLDHQAAPADMVQEAYLTRWSASETTFGEDKTAITGARNRTSGPVMRSGSPRLVIQEAWAWLTATQLVRASAAAALNSQAAVARALHRKDNAPVTADQESFTAARHHAIRSMAFSQVTASSSLDALAAAADAAARAALHTLNVPGRDRHSQRTQKARPTSHAWSRGGHLDQDVLRVHGSCGSESTAWRGLSCHPALAIRTYRTWRSTSAYSEQALGWRSN